MRDAILLTLALCVLGSFVRFNIAGQPVPLIGFVVLSTAVWAAIDSAKLQFSAYRSAIAYGPVVVFFAFLLVWIIAFPWYLSIRHKIQSGSAVLKTATAHGSA